MPRQAGPFVEWPATARYRLAGAPGELGLVQDFLNTIEEGTVAPPDLLASLASAQAWADTVLAVWSSLGGAEWTQQLPAMTEGDRQHLVDVRKRLYESLYEPTASSTRTEIDELVRLSVTAGRVQIVPVGRGWAQFASALVLICHRAQLAGELRRLKTCRNPVCDVVFYDRSKNNRAVWHDVRLCGNRANVRAHRARARRSGV